MSESSLDKIIFGSESVGLSDSELTGTYPNTLRPHNNKIKI